MADDAEKRADDVEERPDDVEQRADDAEKRADDVEERPDDVEQRADDAEQRADEIIVLNSIYGADENFKQVDDNTYQYKYTEGDNSFILEVIWGPNYPSEKPKINLDIFYNEMLLKSVKEKIKSIVDAEADHSLGWAMTFTLIEAVRDKTAEILADQTEGAVGPKVENIAGGEQSDPKKSEKKEQLSKAQKRRAWDQAEAGRGGGKPRGWDWMDIVKHLSKTPPQPPHQPPPE